MFFKRLSEMIAFFAGNPCKGYFFSLVRGTGNISVFILGKIFISCI